MNQVLSTPRAEADLEEIGDYIAADNPARARSFVHEIRSRFHDIACTPRKKLRKLVAADANKRVLLLERQDWCLDEPEVLTAIEHRRERWPDLELVDEIWIVETESEGTNFVDFKLYDQQGLIVRSFAFSNGILFEHSQFGVPLPIERPTPQD